MGGTCACNCVNRDQDKPGASVALEPATEWRKKQQTSAESPPLENRVFTTFADEPPDNTATIQSAFRNYLQRKVLRQQESDLLDFSESENLPDQATADAGIDPLTLLTEKAIKTLNLLPPLSLEKRVQGAVIYPPKFVLSGGVYIGQWSARSNGKVQKGVGRLYADDGSFAQGYWKNGKLHLFGRRIYSNGDYYEGSFFNGLRSGIGKFELFLQKGVYTGEWKDDQRSGHGVEIYADGSRYDGQFAFDVKAGKGTLRWPDGSSYDGNFVDDKMTGLGTYQWSDGRKYVGQWLEGKMHGKGDFTYADGKRYVGEYKNDKKNGYGVYHWDGNEYDGDWFDGKMHGFGYYTNTRGVRKRYEFKEGNKLKEAPEK